MVDRWETGHKRQGQEQLNQEIEELERKLENMKATMPAHESSGSHAMTILELEDELDEKRKALQDDRRGSETDTAHHQGKY